MSVCAALPLAWSRTLGGTLGQALACSEQRLAKVTRRNLALAFPHLCDAQRRDLFRTSLAHTGALLAETGLLWHAPLSTVLNQVVSVEGEGQLDTERGCLILGCHLGNWELLNLWLATRPSRGPLLALFDPQGPAEVVAWIRQRRQRTGARLLPLTTSGLRVALATLRAHGRVGLLVDQVPPLASGVYAPFFGHPALTMTLAQQLLRRSGATAIFATALRQPRGFDLSFRLAQGLDAEDPRLATKALNAGVEESIASAPDQYLWCYKRYKGQPEGFADPYALACP